MPKYVGVDTNLELYFMICIFYILYYYMYIYLIYSITFIYCTILLGTPKDVLHNPV